MKDIHSPEHYPRRILLAVTGLSPQIVTETLYALAIQNRPPFVPTEIHLITTSDGAKLARAALLHQDGGQFHTLVSDYPVLREVDFTESSIHVIIDSNGDALPDIRTPGQNASAADAITALVGELTRGEQSALHVSIAGGRKTMGFYLGYAFSMFARPQDRLSHVLVSQPFESHPDFFYPPKNPRRLSTRDGQHIDTGDAIVQLAEIPFVRLRHGLPENLVRGSATFSETVSALQRSFALPELVIDMKEKKIHCGGIEVRLQPQMFAWYVWHAMRRLKTKGDDNFLHWRDIDPRDFMRIYRGVVGELSEAYEETASQLSGVHKDEEIMRISQEKNAKINRILREKLGSAAVRYLISSIDRKPYTRHGLSLDASCITVYE
ncbi:CRISPR-associated protein (Cas_NE0113) [Ferrovum myxofaciens]|uniref:CRISPR-associated protein (Cas_NE0113) n=1 Tax=Ferrovum myxofaciens TaxID=416213 RepID=A0A149VWG4_9PROT|nr:CRISPR-associated ring nuclease Csm6 [Ferrovum myxofaciens]KXW57581.1 CRISPR-associated protein (Cas_NE0113) [Ferrovum myxofaciens]